MFRTLLTAIVLLHASAAWAGDGLGQLHGFKDWTLGCDNTRRCEAQGYGSLEDGTEGERAVLILRREAGPGAVPQLSFQFSAIGRQGGEAERPAVGESVTVRAGSWRWTAPPIGREWASIDVPPARVAALLAWLLRGDLIELQGRQVRWSVSLAGAAAALLKMDDLQGRVGTPGALARKGARPESSVPLPTVPTVRAATLPATTAADLALEPLLRAALPQGKDDCPDFDAAEALVDLVRLTNTTLLVLQPCWRGAYQTGSRVWQVDDQPPHRTRRLALPGPGGQDQETLVAEMTDTHSGHLSLHESAKGRGIGDCWVTREWTWTGERLALIEATESPCQLFEAGGLSITLWRAQVR